MTNKNNYVSLTRRGWGCTAVRCVVSFVITYQVVPGTWHQVRTWSVVLGTSTYLVPFVSFLCFSVFVRCAHHERHASTSLRLCSLRHTCGMYIRIQVRDVPEVANQRYEFWWSQTTNYTCLLPVRDVCKTHTQLLGAEDTVKRRLRRLRGLRRLLRLHPSNNFHIRVCSCCLFVFFANPPRTSLAH